MESVFVDVYLILRYVDTSNSPIKIEEYFIEFLKVYDTSGKGLFDEVVNLCNVFILYLLHSLNDGKFCKIMYCQSNKISSTKDKRCFTSNLQLSKYCEDPKLKSEVMYLATYDIENAEFLFGMNIWYDILFDVNSILQLKDMHIDVAIIIKKYLIAYLKNDRENGINLALDSSKKLVVEIDLELKFHEKHIIRRKTHFDENVNDEITHLARDSFSY
ncbi:hypothetical protein GmHk_02G004644 [Glycine max]|nr:hypothetical protein GmHk_02G004644 [Glycine max]